MKRCQDCEGELELVRKGLYRCTQCGTQWVLGKGTIRPNKVLFMQLYNDFDGTKRPEFLRRLEKRQRRRGDRAV